MLAMNDKVKVITASDLKPVIDELDEMRSTVETLKEISQPMFQGRHYLTDSALCRRLNICKRTLASYRANGVLGYYIIFREKSSILTLMLKPSSKGTIYLRSNK